MEAADSKVFYWKFRKFRNESSESNEFKEMWEEGIKCQVSLVGI